MPFSNVPEKYRCELKGIQAREEETCPHCGNEHEDEIASSDHWVGMAEGRRGGVFLVRRCEECERSFYHNGSKMYFEKYVREREK
jgi:hypothetical protein